MARLKSMSFSHVYVACHIHPLLGIGKPLRNGGNVLLFVNLDNPVDLCSVAHQLHCAGIHHPLRWVAVDGEVVEEDVGD